jgi:2-polyprenyl-3-methyl-5-hydroxy-6-metoxy-1,4-benzoquinol methylase
MQTNPEIDQDRAFDLYDTYKKYGYVMFPQQRRIYVHLTRRVMGKTVLEVGCGNGVGTAMLANRASKIKAIDKLKGNCDFASQLYPWINFEARDIVMPLPISKFAEVVIAVEIIEHVTYPLTALRNMINAATETVWISTPNGKHAKQPPENPYHVAEYTVDQMLDMLYKAGAKIVTVLSWDHFYEQDRDTDVSPLVYKVEV